MENQEGRNHLEDLDAFFYMTPCFPLQLHVNGSKSLLQCFIVLLLNFFGISMKTMQCLFIQETSRQFVKMQTQSMCKLESRLVV
jgi:hypothetical protein